MGAESQHLACDSCCLFDGLGVGHGEALGAQPATREVVSGADLHRIYVTHPYLSLHLRFGGELCDLWFHFDLLMKPLQNLGGEVSWLAKK